ncbi:MAG: hypothetical protein ABWZ99_08260 [Ilumatobacteraceae bacterium]
MTDQNAPIQPSPGQDSTVDDWHGQEVDRDVDAAERAVTLAGGDEAAAEAIFDDIRPEHTSDRYKVPAEDRPGTIGTEDEERSRPAAAGSQNDNHDEG